MIRQNSIINHKIDKLQLTLEEGLSKFESNGSNDININDQSFIEVMSLYYRYYSIVICKYRIYNNNFHSILIFIRMLLRK